jgi:PST family polysaccharide transporter
MVPMALAGWGAMSLAWSRVAGQLVATILFVWLAPRFYRPGFSVSEAKPALRLGLPLAASNVVVFATLNVDYIIIGRTLSPALLGVYLLAFNLAALPSTVFTSVIRTVAVPAFGRLQLQDRLPEVVPRTIAATVLISAPVCAILAALGGPILNLLFGSEWTAAAAAMAGLAVFSIGRVVTELLADLLVAVGATAILFCIQALWFLALLPTTLVGVHYMGIAGAAVAHAAVIGIVVIPLYAWSAASKAGVGLRSMLVSCSPSLLSASVAAPCGWVVAQYIPTAPLQVVCGSLVIVSVYSALVRNEVARTVSTVRQLT